MRADRLLSILMLLQARRRLTAQQLADELEVSVRTIYRDLDALSAAGVPVYAERGPGGGCSLLDSYRTTLTGLTRDEVRALFMLSIPAPLAELGLDQELKAALFKLSAALPASRRPDEERVRQRIHLDSEPWDETQEPVPHLQTIQRAVWEDRQLHISFRLPFEVQADWLVDPYGLVAKAGTWYLVCARNDQLRVHRVSQIANARPAEGTFERPAGFDLVAFWRAWRASVEDNRSRVAARVLVAPQFVAWLPHYFGPGIRGEIARAGPPDDRGWIELSLIFETLEEARERLLGFGGAIEALEPRALRDSVADHGRQIVGLYG